MFEHKFIRIEMSHGFVTAKPKESYKDIIFKEQKEGWELVQIFASEFSGYGVPNYFDIIFKRKVEI